MRHLAILVCLGISIALCSSVPAAESLGDDRGGDREAANHNFFSTNPWVRSFLETVEQNHLHHSSMAAGLPLLHLIQKGNFKDAIIELQYILTRFVNHPGALYLLCQVAKQANDPSLPIEYFERAIRLYPEYAYTHAQYGTYLVDIGSLAAGMAQLQIAIEQDPYLASAHAGLARAYSKSGKSELAHQASQKAKELGYRDKLVE